MLIADHLTLGHRLQGVDLHLAPGTTTAILGPNGAGKSTLLAALAGLLKVGGRIRWQDRDLPRIPFLERGRILAWLGQESGAEFAFSVREVVAQGRFAWGDEDEAAIACAMATLDIEHLADRRVTELSGGERRRVFLARSLATGAPLQLWDEPASNLDVRHALEVYRLAALLAQGGSTVAITLHDIRAAYHFDQVLVLEQGRLVGAGKPHDVLTADLIREVFRVEARFITSLVPELPE